MGWKVNKRGKATPVNSKFPYGSDSKPGQRNASTALLPFQQIESEDAAAAAKDRELFNKKPKEVSDAEKEQILGVFSNP
mgnify:FL=1